ncbi:unnamed protein product [Soboliphyme baturini]|uniref:Transforming growth factor beta-1-induced transcript 1 protein n=1 Tax=Soboliphyme baturini TaxID=241478 RepID=A0A183J9D3_9BILA|nr:unnamed protein product [Soboliphyme baturini]
MRDLLDRVNNPSTGVYDMISELDEEPGPSRAPRQIPSQLTVKQIRSGVTNLVGCQSDLQNGILTSSPAPRLVASESDVQTLLHSLKLHPNRMSKDFSKVNGYDSGLLHSVSQELEARYSECILR